MHKRTIHFCMLILAVLFYSCEQNAKPVESGKAKTIITNKTENTTTFNKIKDGSIINWNAAHLGGIDPKIGKIYYEKAIILVNNGKVTNTSLTIDMDNLTVDNLDEDEAKDLVEHLKSEDFFNIKKHPTSAFELANLVEIKGHYNSEITGNLILLGVSKSITFKANINVSENEVSIKSEKFIIDRANWGMTYHKKGTADVPLDYLISDNIGLQIVATFVK